MGQFVIVREDEAELQELVTELLEDGGYTVIPVKSVEELIDEATRRSPCVALVDGAGPSSFDLWWLGPVLSGLGVPPIAFTAHASAVQEFEADPRGFAAVIAKPFDADRFLDVIRAVCLDDYKAAVF